MSITSLELHIHDESCLSEMLEAGLHSHTAAIEDTCVAASKEFALEKAMDKVGRYRGTPP